MRADLKLALAVPSHASEGHKDGNPENALLVRRQLDERQRVLTGHHERDVPQDALKLDVGVPTVLFETGAFRPGYDDYAPSGDGQRVLLKLPKERRTLQIRMLLNLPSMVRPTSPQETSN